MTPPEPSVAFDTRAVLRIYAILASAGGFVLFAWGPMWFAPHLPGQPWGRAALVRVFGSILAAAGFTAAGLQRISSPETRHRALFWFALAHLAIVAGLVTQTIAVWDAGDLASAPAIVGSLLISVTGLLFYAWQNGDGHQAGDWLSPTTLFGAKDGPDVERLWSTYEEQIRRAAGQEERNRLARDLHDSIKQQIFAIHTSAATAETRFASDEAGARSALAQVRTSAREAMIEMEAMLDQLRATPLESKGLVEALKKQCEALGFRTGAEVAFEVGDLPSDDRLAPGVQEAIFRVAQEALANVARHARATRVRVRLEAAGDRLTLRVTDDGVGFDPGRRGAGIGLSNMRERAASAGGVLNVLSQPQGGTAVVLSVPVAGRTSLQRRSGRPWPEPLGDRRISLVTTAVLFGLFTAQFVLILYTGWPRWMPATMALMLALFNGFILAFELAERRRLRRLSGDAS